MKLTDEQIIKALECCSTDGGCEDCPAHGTGCELEKPALDLINRQKAEIERLKEEPSNPVIATKDLVISNETVYRIGWEMAVVNAIKAETIKEFWEKLKPWGRHPSSKPFPDNPVLKQCPIWLEDDIYKVVKEMVGE